MRCASGDGENFSSLKARFSSFSKSLCGSAHMNHEILRIRSWSLAHALTFKVMRRVFLLPTRYFSLLIKLSLSYSLSLPLSFLSIIFFQLAGQGSSEFSGIVFEILRPRELLKSRDLSNCPPAETVPLPPSSWYNDEVSLLTDNTLEELKVL